jgi:RNA polymerase sigma-70 factor, ECF subfamily
MSDIPKLAEVDICRKELGITPDDADLILSLQSGCEKSFDALFAKYWKLVFAIAWKILRQRSEAEDIVQDVFLTIYLQSDRYDPSRGSVRTWIAQFAYFKALVRRRFLQTVEMTNLDELKEFESGLLRFGSAEGVLERAAFVEECLGALKPRQRRTVELVHFDGYTLLETATILKQSLANTRNLYYRGINSLRAQLLAAHAGSAPAGTLSDVAAESFILGRT